MLFGLFETKHLYFSPVTVSELQWNADNAKDETARHEYIGIIERGLSNPGNELWYTVWEIRRKADNAFVGAFRMMGPPDEEYGVSLDFNIRDEFSRRGYGSEAFGKVISFLMSEKNCSYVKCKADRRDAVSARFLRKFGFRKIGADSERTLYELEKARRVAVLPMFLFGASLTVALRLLVGKMLPLFWAIVPICFLIGSVFEITDGIRRKDRYTNSKE